MKILERWPVAEIQKKPQINSPEARLVWQLASIQRQMHTLKGSAAKYLIVTEDEDEKLIFEAVAENLYPLHKKRICYCFSYHQAKNFR